MSQDVSTNQRAREPLTAPTSIQPWSAESDADKLMDELFSDIDRILEGGGKLPTEPVKPEYVSLKSIVIPQIAMPPAVMPPQELVQQPTTESTVVTPVEPLEKSVPHTASSPASRSGWSFEKLLLLLLAAGIAVSLVVTAILLLTSQQKLTWPWSLNLGDSSSAQNNPLSESDAQFVNYMLRSLDVIDHKTQTKQKTTTASAATRTTNLSSIPAPSNRTLAPNQPQTVLERVYIPVPMPQTPSAAPVAPQAARPSVPVIPQVARPSVPAMPPAARASVPVIPQVARPPVPATPQAARPSVPASPQAARSSAPVPPQAVAPPAAPPAAPTSAVPTSPAPVSKHTLVGLLTGERPVGLFEVDGVTQRVNLGEAIGASGWALVAVTDKEAIIRRNGEVRSIYPGQKF